jgi:hypothetical protein
VLEYVWNEDSSDATLNARLVYSIASSNMVEAKEGAILTSDGRLFTAPSELHFMDMTDHPALEMVEQLAEQAIMLTADGMFRPEQRVTQQQFLNDLIDMMERFPMPRPTQQLYSRARQQGIIDPSEIDPEAIISTGDALMFIMRYIGHREVAEMTDIFVRQPNTPVRLAGYIAIADALEIVDMRTFRHERELNRLGQAELFFAFLTRR